MIYIIIPVFNNISLRKKGLPSLERQAYKEVKTSNLDDGSKDGTHDFKDFPQYIADEEFTVRSAMQGYQLLVEPSAVVYSNFYKGTKTSLKNTYGALFSIKSPLYLKSRIRFAIKHSPLGILYFPFDFTKIMAYTMKNKN